jgi:hypothetical protein
MVKLVDMPDLGSGAARRVGSSPIIRTKKASQREAFFYGVNLKNLNVLQIDNFLFCKHSPVTSRQILFG